MFHGLHLSDVLTPVPPRDRCMAPMVFLKASSVPKIWNDRVRSQRRRLTDLCGAARGAELVAAYRLGSNNKTLPF